MLMMYNYDHDSQKSELFSSYSCGNDVLTLDWSYAESGPNANLIVYGTTEGTLGVFNSMSNTLLHETSVEGVSSVVDVAFSPLMTSYCSTLAGNVTSLQFWDLATGKMLLEGTALSREVRVNCVHYIPNGAGLFCGCHDGHVRLFDIRSGKSVSDEKICEGELSGLKLAVNVPAAGTATLFTSSKGSKDKVDIKSDTEGYDDYVKGWNAAYESGNYHVGSEWQKKVKSIRLWNNGQACYTKPETLELAAQTLENKYINTATGPYLMVGITDGKGSCDCEDCKAAMNTYGNAAGVQMVFMNKLANKLEEYMKANGIEKQITLVAFAYYAFREPPVKLVNGEYTPVHPDVVPKNDGQVRIGIMYTPIEACYTHPITDETETCEKNATIAAEMKAWASLTTNLMMYSYGTNFQAYKYHFNNWSHIGDSIRFYEKLGLKYYFEQACAQNGISPMSSMRAYVRSKLAWNAAYDTQALIDEFIEHYYGDGAEGVKQYFDAVMENFERIYTLAETEDQDIYYSRIMSADYWTRPLLLQLESYLEKADYAVDLGSSGDKDVYKERIFREYFLLKDNEYTMYSAYLGSDEYAALEELVMYGREKYNAYNSAEKTQNG